MEFLDPETWEPLKSGTKAVIRTADGKMHREFVLALHDFALLFDGEVITHQCCRRVVIDRCVPCDEQSLFGHLRL